MCDPSEGEGRVAVVAGGVTPVRSLEGVFCVPCVLRHVMTACDCSVHFMISCCDKHLFLRVSACFTAGQFS